MTRHKILTAILMLLLVFSIYKNYTLNSTVNSLQKTMINNEQEVIKDRKNLIDSLQKSKILITKQLLQNTKNIQKLKDELSKTEDYNLSIEDAKRLLGL